MNAGVTPTSAKWLLILYAPPGSPTTTFGVVLYVPGTEELYFQFREDTSFIHDEHVDVLAETGTMLRSIAAEHGASRTFRWMESSLSNVVRAEGPFVVVTTDPASTMQELYTTHIKVA
jgi:hypothetical protein